jgi:hypothetical protein
VDLLPGQQAELLPIIIQVVTFTNNITLLTIKSLSSVICKTT